MDDLELIKEYEDKLKAYDLALSTIYFDHNTIAPKGGIDYRFECLDIIEKAYYEIKTDEKVYEALKRLNKVELDSVNKRRVKLLLKSFDDTKKIPQDIYLEYRHLQNEAAINWEEAKNTNNYALFEPYLIKIIEMTKTICKYRNPDIDPYELLLDDYEEGMTIKKYDEFFDLIKTRIIPLIHKIEKKNGEVIDDFIHGNFEIDKQRQVMEIIKKYLHFDKSWGYMSEYMHPFTNAFSVNDVRITTYYRENNLTDSIFSVIHEIGHAIYEHQMDLCNQGTILHNVSSGLHESQSRLFENYLGRSYHFWDTLYPELQKIFHEELKDVDQMMFYKAINKSQCSLIRTMADELTYPVHILIRYEMEKAIFHDEIPLHNLNKTWNKYYEEYLHVKVDSDTNGILQDVHWADGSFGYFPTYALGSAYSAQFMKKMREDLDVDKVLSEGQIEIINNWLKENIHQYQNNITPDEVIINATNENFNPLHYIDYLINKYTEIYNL